MPRTVLITVEGILLRVLDLTDSEIQAVVGTNAQALTGRGDTFRQRGATLQRRLWDDCAIKAGVSRLSGIGPARILLVSALGSLLIGYELRRWFGCWIRMEGWRSNCLSLGRSPCWRAGLPVVGVQTIARHVPQFFWAPDPLKTVIQWPPNPRRSHECERGTPGACATRASS
jgi:hypothetical protein